MRSGTISAKTIRRWIISGKLDADLVDGRWAIHNNAHDGSYDAHLRSQLARADSEIAHLRDQLARRDEQISSVAQQTDHLTRLTTRWSTLIAIAQKNVAVLTEQLDASRQMIESMRRRSWWKRIKAGLESFPLFCKPNDCGHR